MSDKIYNAAVLTVSDKGSKGEREDTSGKLVQEVLEKSGFNIASYTILPDEQPLLEKEMKRICDKNLASLILTTGGTGFSQRDLTPEATIAVSDRLVPGLPEAMRMHSMTITKKAMLSRGAAGIRGRSLIVNLPGSPKAVKESLEFIVTELKHGLDILTGEDEECGKEV